MGVPAANVKVDGRFPVFRSLEERCNACEVYGGEQRPCQPRDILEEIQERDGRPCPRVLLDLDNVEAWELLPHAFDEARLLPVVFPLATRHLTEDGRHAVLRRVLAVVHDQRVAERRRALAERRAREVAAQARATAGRKG